VSGAGTRKRRGIRAVLCVVLALAGLAAVLAIAGREQRFRELRVVARPSLPATATVRAVLASEPEAAIDRELDPSLWHPPLMPPPLPGDEGASADQERSDPQSHQGDDWREQVAAAVGREAVEGAPLNAGAVHTHLDVDGSVDARAPVLLVSAASVGEEKFRGWDGGKFWFGPTGLVRMEEVEP